MAVSFARTARASEARRYSIITGPIVSGEKLVDDAEFKKLILKSTPNAVGGEMECAGIVTSSLVRSVPFAMIKGICDFAEGKTDDYQDIASENAIRLALEMIKSRWTK